MGVYDDWKQPQLQEENKNRGLPAGGANSVLIAQLEADDLENRANDDLLGLAGESSPEATPPAVPSPAAPPAPAPAIPAEQNPPAPQYQPAPPEPPREFSIQYPCSGELSTGVHEDNRLRAYNAALAAGLIPRGGLSGVYRSGWAMVDGTRHAVYQVTLKH